jgi:hypothetical protein
MMDGECCFADFNAFLQVNRALYCCLNPILWQSATEDPVTTAQVLTHLIRNNNLARLKSFLQIGVDIETALPVFNTSDRELRRSSPLAVATYLDNVPLARLLLENGAKVRDEPLHSPIPPTRWEPRCSTIHAARSAAMVQLPFEHHANPRTAGLLQRSAAALVCQAV